MALYDAFIRSEQQMVAGGNALKLLGVT